MADETVQPLSKIKAPFVAMTARQKRATAGIATVAAVVTAATMAYFLPSSSDAEALAFEANFATASDFYDRFDYGYSGQSPYDMQGGSQVFNFHGDHNVACQGPTTDRNVAIGGPASNVDFSQMFWHCAPGGSDTGHVMTGLSTTGYNIVWFSPKPQFTAVQKVCWDINATMMSRRKWTQVVFVSAADSIRFPAGTATQGSGFTSKARGSGGFDLGFPNPDHRTGSGPSTGIDPIHPIAGFMSLDGSANYFVNAGWTSQFNGPNYHGDPQDRDQTTDKAARYKHCLERVGTTQVKLTRDTPGQGTVSYTMSGTIPQGAVRVVFEDDEYDGVKDDRWQANLLTWHWDNIQVFTEGSAPPSTTSPPTTPPPTTAPTTTAPTTTTTQPTTTTTAATTTTSTTLPTTTTTAATTTTVAPTTTTTLPVPACPSTFTQVELAWCQLVNQRLDALEAGS